VGSKAFGGLHRRLKEKTAESRWFETTGQAPFGRAKAAYWKINVGFLDGTKVFRQYGRLTSDGWRWGVTLAVPALGHLPHRAP
jgi:hypothetical protein